MGLIVNFSDFENISATNLSVTDYVIGYRPGPNREIRSTIEDFSIFIQSLSSNNVYVAVTANSANWNSTYSTVKSLSDTWEESVYITPLQVASASWDSVYSTVNSLSDTWEESVYITPLQVASASWDSVYSNVNSNSANYILDGGNTKGSNISIGTNDAYDLIFKTNNIAGLLITSDTLSGNSSKTSFGAGSATGLYSFATGYNTTAFGNYSYAEGINNTALGYASHAQGAGNLASNNYSHAQGENNIASGESSYAGGGDTLASGTRSTATGQFTSATKTNSYASGRLAFANHNRSWVWQGTNQDGVSAQFTSTRTDQFAIRPTNGFFLSGAMGIGTDSIANALTVSGNISARDTVIADALSARYLGLVHTPAGDGIDPSIRMGETDTTGFSGVFISYNESTNVFGISSLLSPASAVGPAIAIDRNSNVGIGTDAPDQKLHVLKGSAGAVTADPNSIAVFEGGGSNHIAILTPNGNTGGVVFGSPSDNYGSYLSWNYDNNELKLGTDKTGGFISLLTNDEAEAVRITSTGNVGIGTIVPAQKLTVSGNVSALSAVYHIGNPPGTIPVFLTIRNINALASTGTRTVGYNVPTGKRFLTNSYSFVVTNTDQSSAFAVAPSIAITNGSTNKLANDLTFSSGLTAPSYGIGNISSSGGSFGSGNTLRHTSTDTVGVSIVTPAYGGGTQTVFTGDVVIVGSLIDL